MQEAEEGDTIGDEEIVFGGKRLELILVDNWGIGDKIGLTGISVIGEGDKIIEINREAIECSLGEEEVSILISGDNVTTNVEKMWCASWKQDQEIVITFNFGSFIYISGKNLENR